MPRIVFRAFSEDDALAFFGTVQRYADALLPWVDTPHRVTDISRAKASVSARLSNGQAARFGVFLGDEILGSAKLIEVDLSVPDYEIGAWCVPHWRGKGLGKWLTRCAVDVAFSYEASRVTLRHAVNNASSRAVIESIGATKEGCLRQAARVENELQNMFIYGILRTEWADKKAVHPCQRLFREF